MCSANRLYKNSTISIWIRLLPALLVLLPLMGGSMLYMFTYSLGQQSLLGESRISLEAYRHILVSVDYGPKFWESLLFSLWISLASTLLSACFAILVALLIRNSCFGRRSAAFLLQASLPIPHLVAAIAVLLLFSQSGLLARGAYYLGFISKPADFPVLTRDTRGIGIIIAYLWKEIPFLGLVVLAALAKAGTFHEESARTLGANAWQRFCYIIFPQIFPALSAASILVFSYVLGACEIPELLGTRNPQGLPSLAWELFVSPDLRDRVAGMALSVLMTILGLSLVALYQSLAKRAEAETGRGG